MSGTGCIEEYFEKHEQSYSLRLLTVDMPSTLKLRETREFIGQEKRYVSDNKSHLSGIEMSSRLYRYLSNQTTSSDTQGCDWSLGVEKR